ncbi:hypothetical protein [Halostella pelagica]|uniref:hypothetical protein n=1 Tax=Halostella pelagica TaxID=2583824 RepID=UPI0010810EE6|nr:hypothetical protein [Halostella pelagica]
MSPRALRPVRDSRALALGIATLTGLAADYGALHVRVRDLTLLVTLFVGVAGTTYYSLHYGYPDAHWTFSRGFVRAFGLMLLMGLVAADTPALHDAVVRMATVVAVGLLVMLSTSAEAMASPADDPQTGQ